MNKDLIVEKTINILGDKSLVWDLLTNPDKVRQYMFGAELISDWTVGGPIVFQGEFQGQQYKDGGTILALEPERLLRYTYWSGFSGLEQTNENHSQVTFELEEQGGQTNLRMEQQGFVNEETRDHTDGNWDMVLNQIKAMAEND